ncbi:hypothetical protein [Spirosoma panaciterrae]|uniref:hypothetical protein n=1 Tax=Spirosoma panaciterrae TaxID=496058 RepID=UPI0012FAAEDD|nr:hypothetical protein [Spirosoma panaciterrae]
MMLLIDGMYKGGHYENVTHWVQSYESAFERLTQLVANQWTLTTILLVDNGDCMYLPAEAFDGQPIQIHIETLQQEWTQLLSAKPCMQARSGELRLRDWYLQLDEYYADLLDHLKKMIVLLESRKVKVSMSRNERLKEALSRGCDYRLELNKKLFIQTQKDRQKNHQRLQKLVK